MTRDPAPLMSLSGFGVSLGGRRVLEAIDLAVGPGEFVGLIGPNGAGKTTLLRAALGLIPAHGRSSLAELPARERARTCSFVPQSGGIAWPLSVERLVGLGRHGLGSGQAADSAAVDRALSSVGLGALRDRLATSLSGGEQARALLARALARECPLLLADEPLAGLDPAAQIGAMELFAGLAREGRSVVASLHDLGLAARWCTRVIVLFGGVVVVDGLPVSVLSGSVLGDVFGIVARVERGSDGVVLVPLGRVPGSGTGCQS